MDMSALGSDIKYILLENFGELWFCGSEKFMTSSNYLKILRLLCRKFRFEEENCI